MLPNLIYPETLSKKCPNGFEYAYENLKLESKGIFIYLENDILELKEHKGKSLIFTCLFHQIFKPSVK